MPDPQPSPRLTLGDLAAQALAAAEPGERLRLVGQLARGTRDPEQMAAVADLLLARPPDGDRAFLEWVARLRGPVPGSVLAKVVPLLSARRVPVPVRVATAARVLRAIPDRVAAVRPVTRALTRGLSPLRGLERLRQLQHQVETNRALDVLIDRREQRVKMDCPRCGVRLPRVEMVKHLWHEHGLLLERGKVRAPDRLLADWRDEHAATRSTDPLDRAALVAGEEALRAWLPAADTPAEDTAPQRAAAAEHDCGLCPGCFAELTPAVPGLPPPLVLDDGRLAGDGYVVRVGGAQWLRTLTVSTPERVTRAGPDRHPLGPRGAATLAALPVLLAALGCAFVIPPRAVPPYIVACWLVLAAGFVYAVVRLARRPLPPPDDRAVDAAWAVLARRLVEKDEAARFLTRLCLTSPGRGDPEGRAGVLTRLTERAAEGAGESDESRQLLAAARVLQVDDAARLGRDRVAGLAELIADGLAGEHPTAFAEHAAAAVLARDPPLEPGELARLRVLLVAAAFDAGLKPRDLLDLWAVAPALRRVAAVEPPHRLGLLHGVWLLRNVRRWERVAPADTVFELARTAPNVSGRVLAEFPDLLLYHRTDPDLDRDLGPVLVCTRGVVVGGQLAADPDAEVRQAKAGRFGGGYELTFGRHRVRLTRKLPDEFLEAVRGWLRFRANVLLPHIDGYLDPGSPEVAGRVLGPFSRTCGRCGATSAVAVGKVGIPVRAAR
jgi:hypothetical protein